MKKDKLHSDCYSFDLPLKLKKGIKWQPYPIFHGATASADELSCHMSALAPGVSPHPPHEHQEEEILIILSGEVDVILKESCSIENVTRQRLRKNQFVYYPAHFAHTLEAAGKESANYLMLKWNGASVPRNNMLSFCYFDAQHSYDETQKRQGFSPRRVFEGPTCYLEKLQCHTTILDAGAGYPPHADAYDVAILMLEGEVRTLGKNIKAPGVIFYAAGKPHGILNTSDSPAKYLVFEFHGNSFLMRNKAFRFFKNLKRADASEE